MSSRSDPFECRWRPSRTLLAVYLTAQVLAWVALGLLSIPTWLALSGWLLCLGHAAWVLPRCILFTHRRAFRALRHGPDGWQVGGDDGRWRPARICADSLVIPWLVVVRFKLADERRFLRFTHSLCIPRDALPADAHRRLRVRLRFARHG